MDFSQFLNEQTDDWIFNSLGIESFNLTSRSRLRHWFTHVRNNHLILKGDILEFGVPINIAIIHPKDCVMTLEGYGCVPFEEGKAFIINIRNYHSVINPSNQSRIHLISHGIPGKSKKEFAELVARSYRKQYEYS